MYIAIAGNIGSGKTTLTEILTKHYGAKAYYEDIDNPYINDFYEDMNRWAFQFQVQSATSLQRFSVRDASRKDRQRIHTEQVASCL